MLRYTAIDQTTTALLTEVLETVVTKRQLEGTAAREACARELMGFYRSGATKRGELLSCMGVHN